MATTRLCVKSLSFSKRDFSSSAVCCGLRNFRKLQLYNWRGSRRFKEKIKENPDPRIPIYTFGVREPGYTYKGKFHVIPEMVPELIVPNLENFELKPYVSYKVKDVVQSEFTSYDLFKAIYAKKIKDDFEKGELDEDGNPKEPNDYEKMTAEEAKIKALQTGSDIFEEIYVCPEEPEEYPPL